MYLINEKGVLRDDYELQIEEIFINQLNYKLVAKQSSIVERKVLLQQLTKNIIKRKKEFETALSLDFNQAALGSNYFETYYLLRRIKKIIELLEDYLTPKKVANDTSKANLHSIVEPKGNVLIITQWNFFVNLPILQLCANIAVGNTVFLKLSEGAWHINNIIRTLLLESFPKDLVSVVEGNDLVIDKLLSLKFDHIQFNGSTEIAKKISKAAAHNLSSVSMKLSTKCPAFVDKNTDIGDAVDKIIWGKFFSAGPSYVAPDYVLIHSDIETQFLGIFEERFKYAQKEKSYLSPDFSHIINYEQFDRLYDLYHNAISNGAIDVIANDFDRNKLYISPTVIKNVNTEMRIMQEGVLGPILPIVVYKEFSEALSIVNARFKPEAIYVYSKDTHFVTEIVNHTNSRRLCVNEVFIQNINGFIMNKDYSDVDLENVEIWSKFDDFSDKRIVMFVHDLLPNNHEATNAGQKKIWNKILNSFK